MSDDANLVVSHLVDLERTGFIWDYGKQALVNCLVLEDLEYGPCWMWF